MIARLREEEKKQTEHVARVLAKLENEKDQWFRSGLSGYDCFGEPFCSTFVTDIIEI